MWRKGLFGEVADNGNDILILLSMDDGEIGDFSGDLTVLTGDLYPIGEAKLILLTFFAGALRLGVPQKDFLCSLAGVLGEPPLGVVGVL